jgi:hypothetical protein
VEVEMQVALGGAHSARISYAHPALLLAWMLALPLIGGGASANATADRGEVKGSSPSTDPPDASAPPESAARFAPDGAWYVLIHYRETASGSPEELKLWDERIWTFEREGARVRWTEYPFAIFEQRTGRFEDLGSVKPARSLGFWEPDKAQRAQIELGLACRAEGSRSKSLRGSREAGFHSTGGMRAQSASMIGYSESWSISDLESLPVFSFDARMGSGHTEDIEGRTQYRVTEIGPDGGQLVGRYERDGTRHGTFRMSRMGALRIQK